MSNYFNAVCPVCGEKIKQKGLFPQFRKRVSTHLSEHGDTSFEDTKLRHIGVQELKEAGFKMERQGEGPSDGGRKEKEKDDKKNKEDQSDKGNEEGIVERLTQEAEPKHGVFGDVKKLSPVKQKEEKAETKTETEEGESEVEKRDKRRVPETEGPSGLSDKGKKYLKYSGLAGAIVLSGVAFYKVYQGYRMGSKENEESQPEESGSREKDSQEEKKDNEEKSREDRGLKDNGQKELAEYKSFKEL